MTNQGAQSDPTKMTLIDEKYHVYLSVACDLFIVDTLTIRTLLQNVSSSIFQTDDELV